MSNAAKKIEAAPEGVFDLRVTIKDPKTGEVLKHQPYRLSISKEHGTIYTRDGICYHGDGSLVDPKPQASAPPKGQPNVPKPA